MEIVDLSIVTVVKNDPRVIATAESIAKCFYLLGISKSRNTEFIIQSPSFYEELKQVKIICPFALINIEADVGIYNAMNLAVAKAKGSYVYFLNAGDSLIPDAMCGIINLLKSVSCDVIVCNTLNTRFKSSKLIPMKNRPGYLFGPFFGVFASHQGYIVSSRVFRDLRGFKESIKISADHHFMALVYYMEFSHCFIDLPIANFDLTGFSQASKPFLRYGEIIRWIASFEPAPIRLKIIAILYWLFRFPFALASFQLRI